MCTVEFCSNAALTQDGILTRTTDWRGHSDPVWSMPQACKICFFSYVFVWSISNIEKPLGHILLSWASKERLSSSSSSGWVHPPGRVSTTFCPTSLWPQWFPGTCGTTVRHKGRSKRECWGVAAHGAVLNTHSKRSMMCPGHIIWNLTQRFLWNECLSVWLTFQELNLQKLWQSRPRKNSTFHFLKFDAPAPPPLALPCPSASSSWRCGSPIAVPKLWGCSMFSPWFKKSESVVQRKSYENNEGWHHGTAKQTSKGVLSSVWSDSLGSFPHIVQI